MASQNYFEQSLNKFNFIPAGNVDTASSRLRVYALVDALRELGCDARINSSEFSKCLIIQKRVTLDLLERVRSAKLAGSYIVYDIDDSSDALWFWAQPKLLLPLLLLADLVTTDTPERARWVSHSASWLNCQVIPNPVDYGILSPKPIRTDGDDEISICWFGSTSTFENFAPLLRSLSKIPKTKIIICGANTEDSKKFSKFSNIEFVDWERAGMEAILQKSDLVCLSHFGRKEDIRKSNHKMITSICFGVPAIVSNTPEYSRAAHEIGAPDSIFHDEKTLLECVEKFRSRKRREEYLQKAQPIIWKKYSPSACAKHFFDVIQQNQNIRNPTSVISRDVSPVRYALWRWRIDDYKMNFIKNLLLSKCK